MNNTTLKRNTLTTIAVCALALVTIPIGATAATAATVDPITGMPTDTSTPVQPGGPGAGSGIDPITGMPIDGATPEDPTPVTITQGERVGTKVQILITAPADGKSYVTVLDRRGQGTYHQPLSGNTTLLVDAPFGKHRSYSVTVERPLSKWTQKSFDFDLGGPRI